MQRQGNDEIDLTFTNAIGQHLHLTPKGHFQFGSGKERQIVTSLDQVEGFGDHVTALVTAWLAKNGAAEAAQEKADQAMQQRSTEAPGSLDAMAERLGDEVKTKLFMLLSAALGGTLTEADLASLKAMPPGGYPKPAVSRVPQEASLPSTVVPEGAVLAQVDAGVMLTMPNGEQRLIEGAELEQQDGGTLLRVPGEAMQFFPGEMIDDGADTNAGGVKPGKLKPAAEKKPVKTSARALAGAKA
jgi:hypothetical protein